MFHARDDFHVPLPFLHRFLSRNTTGDGSPFRPNLAKITSVFYKHLIPDARDFDASRLLAYRKLIIRIGAERGICTPTVFPPWVFKTHMSSSSNIPAFLVPSPGFEPGLIAFWVLRLCRWARRAYALTYYSMRFWWKLQDLNLWPLPCKSSALTSWAKLPFCSRLTPANRALLVFFDAPRRATMHLPAFLLGLGSLPVLDYGRLLTLPLASSRGFVVEVSAPSHTAILPNGNCTRLTELSGRYLLHYYIKS